MEIPKNYQYSQTNVNVMEKSWEFIAQSQETLLSKCVSWTYYKQMDRNCSLPVLATADPALMKVF